MDILRDADIDMAPLSRKRVAILGYGNQGRAQALNLKDSGVDVIVGLRSASRNVEVVKAAGLKVAPTEKAASSADVVMLLAPDEVLASVYTEIEHLIRHGAAIGFSHGLAIHFGLIRPRRDLDVFMVAPKGPGSALRSLYEQGNGMIGLWAVAQDASGNAAKLAAAYGKAIGCARAGLIASSFAEECEADLFNEQAVVWGAVPEILIAGFEILTHAGFSPEVAFLECVSELKLLAELVEERGIAAMREAISNTAELGSLLGGPRIVDHQVRERMQDILAEIRTGEFARELQAEAQSGHPRLRRAREDMRRHLVERTFSEFRKLSEKL